MSEELDLFDWIKAIDKQIENQKYYNTAPFRVCKKCGDSGKWLERQQHDGMYYLVINVCECGSGSTLQSRWNQTSGEQ